MTYIGVLAGGLGLGTIGTAMAQHFLARSAKAEDTRLAERREAFTELLATISDLDRAGVTGDPEAEIRYSLSVAHVYLVASREVLSVLERWRNTEPETEERGKEMDALVAAMRRDLGIVKYDS